jgi:hypothetical protein
MSLAGLWRMSGYKNLAMTGRRVPDNPVRTLSDQVGERISAATEGRPAAEVVPFPRPA